MWNAKRPFGLGLIFKSVATALITGSCSKSGSEKFKILKGEKAPKEITLGSSVFDKQNVAQGGQALN